MAGALHSAGYHELHWLHVLVTALLFQAILLDDVSCISTCAQAICTCGLDGENVGFRG